MKTTPKQYAQVLLKLVEESPKKEIPQQIEAFVGLLKKNYALSLAPRIMKAFEKLAEEQQGQLSVQIISKHVISSTQKQSLEKMIKKESGAKEILWQEKILPTMIGGFQLQYGNTLIDMSVKRYLKDLRTNLKKVSL